MIYSIIKLIAIFILCLIVFCIMYDHAVTHTPVKESISKHLRIAFLSPIAINIVQLVIYAAVIYLVYSLLF